MKLVFFYKLKLAYTQVKKKNLDELYKSFYKLACVEANF